MNLFIRSWTSRNCISYSLDTPQLNFSKPKKGFLEPMSEKVFGNTCSFIFCTEPLRTYFTDTLCGVEGWRLHVGCPQAKRARTPSATLQCHPPVLMIWLYRPAHLLGYRSRQSEGRGCGATVKQKTAGGRSREGSRDTRSQCGSQEDLTCTQGLARELPVCGVDKPQPGNPVYYAHEERHV